MELENLHNKIFKPPSHFVIEKLVETIITSTQSITPIYPNLTTSRSKNTTLPEK